MEIDETTSNHQVPARHKPMPTGIPVTDSESGEKKTAGRHLWIVVVLCALLLSGAAWVVWRQRAASVNKSGAPPAGPGTGPVPVVAGMVAQKDFPIYLDGLGTVQAFNTVTVHVRVDGQLQKVVFVEGQDVHAGDVLAQIDPAPFQTQVEQDEAKKAQDEAQLANARVELKRDTELLASKVLSQADYDAQNALVNQLAAAVKADQAAIDSAKVQLAYSTVLAPIDGRAGIRQVDAGNIVHANDANGIVVITQLRPISLVFTLPEQDLGDIQARLTAGEPLSVFAMDRDNNKTVSEGKLAVVDNQIDTTTGTIRLKATFPNDNLRLWPGQFVNARLVLTTRKDGIVVPAQVIQRGPEGAYAFVIDNDMSAQVRPVKVARIDQEQALIDEGLRPGERVVVDGQYKLQPGSRVKLSDSAPPNQTGRDRPAGKGDKAKPGL
jgi:multidrug efflux system membrane fusion protein